MAALPVMRVTRDEYDPRSTGVRSVSAVTTRMSLGAMPSSSATTYASTESEPWPMSVEPQNTVTPPPRSILICTPECGIAFQ
jgi:hypothetical protein